MYFAAVGIDGKNVNFLRFNNCDATAFQQLLNFR